MRHSLRIACVACLLIGWTGAHAQAQADAIRLAVAAHREFFYRGEDVLLQVTCANATGATMPEGAAQAALEGVVASANIPTLAAGEARTVALRVGTSAVRVGRYDVSIRLTVGGQTLAEATEAIEIVRRPNPNRFDVWLWCNGPRLGPFYRDHGFTAAGGPRFPHDPEGPELPQRLIEIRRALDAYMATGMDVSVVPHGGIWYRDFNLIPPKGPDVHYLGAGRKGEQYFNPFNAEVSRVHDVANCMFMDALKDLPNVRFAFVDMEHVNALWKPNRNPEGVALMQQALGVTDEDVGPPKFVAPGVLADDDRGYALHKFVYKRGNGLAEANERTAAMVHRFRPDVRMITDPYRTTALLDMFPGVDLISTWTYTNPDPKRMLYCETLRAVSAPSNQGWLQVVTLLNYPGELAPTDQWMLMGPGRTKVTSWIILSRAAKGIGYFYSSACPPENTEDDFRVPAATSLAIKELSDKVFKPYGPMIAQLDVAPRQIAVLSSQTSRLYGTSPRTGRHAYPNEQIYPFYSLLAMCHLQGDVLFDEHIERYGLKGYSVLVLPRCDVLTKKVYDEVLAFQKRGGILIADQYLGPDISDVTRFDFDFSFLTRVNADAIAKGMMLTAADDRLRSGSATFTPVIGVTALDAQRIMETYAARLKEGLAGRVASEVDCDEPTVLLNVLEKEGIKYLVVINDKRTYDDRVGKYQAVLGKIEPQTVALRVATQAAAELHAYDLIERKALDVQAQDGTWRITVDLTDLGGKLIALYPRRIASLAVQAPASLKLGEKAQIALRFKTPGGSAPAGLQPMQVTFTDPQGREGEFSDYYCARNGALDLEFIAAVNDTPGVWRVTANDLTAGLTAEAMIHLTR